MVTHQYQQPHWLQMPPPRIPAAHPDTMQLRPKPCSNKKTPHSCDFVVLVPIAVPAQYWRTKAVRTLVTVASKVSPSRSPPSSSESSSSTLLFSPVAAEDFWASCASWTRSARSLSSAAAAAFAFEASSAARLRASFFLASSSLSCLNLQRYTYTLSVTLNFQ